jgi:hypothetical protein
VYHRIKRYFISLLRIRYQTIEFGDVDIHLRTLRDRQQYLDVDDVAGKLGISSATWPLFGVVWVAGKRILKVGCGIALASLVLNHRFADITATNYHPEAGHFLVENVQLNKGKEIPFVRMGWGR